MRVSGFLNRVCAYVSGRVVAYSVVGVLVCVLGSQLVVLLAA